MALQWRVVYVPNQEEYLFLVPQPNGGTKVGSLAGDRYTATRRRLVREGIRILGAQVSRKAVVGPVRAKLLLTAELWDQAARPVDSFGEMAVLYKEQMDAQIRNQAETIGLSKQVTGQGWPDVETPTQPAFLHGLVNALDAPRGNVAPGAPQVYHIQGNGPIGPKDHERQT